MAITDWVASPTTGETSMEELLEAESDEDIGPDLTGAQQPQAGAVAPDVTLGEFTTEKPGLLHLLGCHGGAGEGVVSELIGGIECHHQWPTKPETQGSIPVALVGRTDARGLKAVSNAIRDWASGGRPQIDLSCLILVRDGPTKLPKELENQIHIVSGTVPQTWLVPWIPSLRETGIVDFDSLRGPERKKVTRFIEAFAATERE